MIISGKDEEYFPRGGTGGAAAKIAKRRNFIFEKTEKNVEKKKKPGRRERNKLTKAAQNSDIELQEDEIFSRFEPLTYQGLSEGTLTLASVREINKKYVDLSLPGRLSARLYIEDVSNPYTKVLQEHKGSDVKKDKNELSSLFRVGHHLCCCVQSVKNLTHYAVRVSSDPRHVNSHLSFDMVEVGHLIQMAVMSQEDHGYMLFSGVNNLIAFLPNPEAQNYIFNYKNGLPLVVGEVVWCTVTKTKSTPSSNMVHVTIDLDKIKEQVLRDNITVAQLNPGVRVDITVKKILNQNLIVSVNNTEISGFVDSAHLSSPWSKPEDYGVGSVHSATVLYKFPYAKNVVFSLKSTATSQSKAEIELGHIFKRAEIMFIIKRGVSLKLMLNDKVYKGIISVRRLGPNANYEKMASMFPIGNHIQCRVIGYDALEETYSCSTEDHLLTEKYLSYKDLTLGSLVEVTVEQFVRDGCAVSLGALKGFVPNCHLADVLLSTPSDKIKLKSKHQAKVLKADSHCILFTLRPSLVKNPSLVSFDDVMIGDWHYGTVNKILNDSIAVSFFGVYTHISAVNLKETSSRYRVGQLVKCFVVNKEPGKRPVFSLVKSLQIELTVGGKHDLRVININREGLTCFFVAKEKQFHGFIPIEHMSDHPDLCKQIMDRYPYGAVIKNVILFTLSEKLPLFTLRESVAEFFRENSGVSQGLKGVKTELLVPCSVSEIRSDEILVTVPIPEVNAKIVISDKFLPNGETKNYKLHQGLIAKVYNVDVNYGHLKLTCILTKHEKLNWSFSHLEKYLRFITPLQKFAIGSAQRCIVQSVASNFLQVSLKSSNEVCGILRSTSDLSDYKVGSKVKGTVIFHDPISRVVYLHHGKEKFIGQIDCEAMSVLLNKNVKVTVLYGNNNFLLSALRGTPFEGQLIYTPVNLNPNSSMPSLSIENIGFYNDSSIIRLVSAQMWTSFNFWMGNLKKNGKESLFNFEKNNSLKRKADKSLEDDNNDAEEDKCNTTEKKSKKKKKDNKKERLSLGDVPEYEELQDDDLEEVYESGRSVKEMGEVQSEKKIDGPSKKKKRKSDNEDMTVPEYEIFPDVSVKSNKSSSKNKNDSLAGLSVDFKWDATEEDLAKVVSGNMESDDSSQDSDEEKNTPKKLTSAEKKAATKDTELRIREKEEELLLAEENPQSADHYERLIVTYPNSSKIWIQYMAYHLQGTEIEKARSVARRGLKQINIRLEQERLNIWVALLNLENHYGTPDSFKEIITESLKYNDEYKVYKHLLKIYSESNKVKELEQLSNEMVRKLRDKVDCWFECQDALMKVGLHDKARSLLQRSLTSLPNREHCSLISRFALLENRYGFHEKAHALFENLLATCPKRLDLWFVYVDMLAKSGTPDLARNVLERAAVQKFPVKKVKAIYQKWTSFEETYGTRENVVKVEEAALQYVDSLKSSSTS